MSDDEPAPVSGARPRNRKPTPAERREQRARVDSVGEVLDSAARFLEARPRSESEVRTRLTRSGYRPELVEEAVARLLDLHYLDDGAFARAWTESRDRSSPRGEHALRMELGRKGVDRSVVDEVLGERRDTARDHAAAMGDEAPVSPDALAAERLLRKRLPTFMREADPRKRRQKAYAQLARSGFSPDVCSSVSRQVLADAEADAAADETDELDGQAD
jgi:regulatory protein